MWAVPLRLLSSSVGEHMSRFRVTTRESAELGHISIAAIRWISW